MVSKSFDKLLLENQISMQAFKVLTLLKYKVEYNNFINLRQADIAEELKMKQGNVSNSLKELISLGIIVKVRNGQYKFVDAYLKYAGDLDKKERDVSYDENKNESNDK